MPVSQKKIVKLDELLLTHAVVIKHDPINIHKTNPHSHNISKHIHMHKTLIWLLLDLTRKLEVFHFSSYLTRNFGISQSASRLLENNENFHISSRVTRNN